MRCDILHTSGHASDHSPPPNASSPEAGSAFDRPQYRQRNVGERLFGWLKEKRRLNTRCDKLTVRAMVMLARIERCMEPTFQTEPNVPLS